MKNLNKFYKNIYSQNGEDGIIQEILLRLYSNEDTKNTKHWCVEFGAWDGKHLSNTFFLVENKNWNAVYIEGDQKKFLDLKKTAQLYKNIIPVCAFVEHEKNKENSLDSILNNYELPFDFDLLSIDIDSHDLAVWESFDNFKPKIVIIEINSSYLPGILVWNSEKMQGNSFSSTLNVAAKKGYTLVIHTGNMIFVRSDLIESIHIEKRYVENPELLFNYSWINMGTKKTFLERIYTKLLKILNKKMLITNVTE